jgi:NADPH-dependent 7-cyano-7-deazaguanine reductase QueF
MTAHTPVLGRDAALDLITADQLDTWPAPPGDTVVTITTSELTALCPGVERRQPDFYAATIRYRPNAAVVEGKSFKLYCEHFRDRRIGVEDLAAEIRDALAERLHPHALTVVLVQNPRGGHVLTA